MTARRLIGAALAVVGAALLVGLWIVIYDHRASTLIVDLGIPGALLVGLAGLALLLGGGAIVLGRRLRVRSIAKD